MIATITSGFVSPNGVFFEGPHQSLCEAFYSSMERNPNSKSLYETYKSEHGQSLSQKHVIKDFLVSVLGWIVVGNIDDKKGQTSLKYPDILLPTKNKQTMVNISELLDMFKQNPKYTFIPLKYEADQYGYMEPNSLKRDFQKNLNMLFSAQDNVVGNINFEDCEIINYEQLQQKMQEIQMQFEIAMNELFEKMRMSGYKNPKEFLWQESRNLHNPLYAPEDDDSIKKEVERAAILFKKLHDLEGMIFKFLPESKKDKFPTPLDKEMD